MKHDTRTKYSADKIALVVILFVAAFIAKVVVDLKSTVPLTAPVKLGRTGMSIAMPDGNGWHVQKPRYGNGCVLRSYFARGPRAVAAGAECRYSLIPLEEDPQSWFAERAASVDGVIVETGRVRKGPLQIDWAHIQARQGLADTFLGVCAMPNGHQLYIRVYQSIGDTRLAKETFERIIDGIVFDAD